MKSALPDEILLSVESFLLKNTGGNQQITEVIKLDGGCINDACTLITRDGKFFLKYNSSAAYTDMFEKEAAGLKTLAETKAIQVPDVLGFDKTENFTYLLLKHIEKGVAPKNFWVEFGTKLANLHQNTWLTFGLDYDNYIGSLVQTNQLHTDFYSFFISQRIEPQLKNARDKGAFSQSDMRYFDSLFKSLPDIIPAEKPSLLHGDLWSGNFMVTAEGTPCLFDPAVYYGHRESDIAMTKLFGGFNPDFYEAYNQAWPMEKGWQKRIDIFNLYPLLVHVNLFGGGYARQVLQIIRQF